MGGRGLAFWPMRRCWSFSRGTWVVVAVVLLATCRGPRDNITCDGPWTSSLVTDIYFALPIDTAMVLKVLPPTSPTHTHTQDCVWGATMAGPAWVFRVVYDACSMVPGHASLDCLAACAVV